MSIVPVLHETHTIFTTKTHSFIYSLHSLLLNIRVDIVLLVLVLEWGSQLGQINQIQPTTAPSIVVVVVVVIVTIGQSCQLTHEKTTTVIVIVIKCKLVHLLTHLIMVVILTEILLDKIQIILLYLLISEYNDIECDSELSHQNQSVKVGLRYNRLIVLEL